MEHSESLIEHSCQVKRKMVVEDELDNGIRLYLNFGHTIGHAIEATAGYGKVMHGEAVAMGMVQVSKVAEEKDLCQLEYPVYPRNVSEVWIAGRVRKLGP